MILLATLCNMLGFFSSFEAGNCPFVAAWPFISAFPFMLSASTPLSLALFRHSEEYTDLPQFVLSNYITNSSLKLSAFRYFQVDPTNFYNRHVFDLHNTYKDHP